MKCIKKALRVIAFAAIVALPFTGCQPVTDGQAEEAEVEAAELGRYAEDYVKLMNQ